MMSDPYVYMRHALVSVSGFSAADADSAITLIQPVVQSLEKRLDTKLKLVSLKYDKASNSYEIYFRYQAPLISVATLIDNESDILMKLHALVPQLRNMTMFNDSWSMGFGISLRNGIEEIVYLTINSKEDPISVEDLVKFKNLLQEYK